MRYLLDTHTLIWFIVGDEQLSNNARGIIEDEAFLIFVSIVSLWEISIKSSLGKLQLLKPFEVLFPQQLEENDFKILEIKIQHLNILSNLFFHHRDPFDRLIVCQSLVEEIPVISKDSLLDNYNIKRVW